MPLRRTISSSDASMADSPSSSPRRLSSTTGTVWRTVSLAAATATTCGSASRAVRPAPAAPLRVPASSSPEVATLPRAPLNARTRDCPASAATAASSADAPAGRLTLAGANATSSASTADAEDMFSSPSRAAQNPRTANPAANIPSPTPAKIPRRGACVRWAGLDATSRSARRKTVVFW